MSHNKLRALALAATPGRWLIDDDGIYYEHAMSSGEVVRVAVATANGMSTPYIAAANPTVVLGLLDRIDELERLVESFTVGLGFESAKAAELEARIDKALALHRNVCTLPLGLDGHCRVCDNNHAKFGMVGLCAECNCYYPCPTAQALTDTETTDE